MEGGKERKTQGESKHAIVPSVQRVLIVSQVPFTYTHIDVRTYEVLSLIHI